LIGKITDTAFATARMISEEHSVDRVEAAKTACEVAEGAARSTIDKMADFDQRMRGKGYPSSVPKKDTSIELQKSIQFISKRGDAEITILSESQKNRDQERAVVGKQNGTGLKEPWWRKPVGIVVLGVIIGLLVAIFKMKWPNIFR
jgi:hypothetical protein